MWRRLVLGRVERRVLVVLVDLWIHCLMGGTWSEVKILRAPDEKYPRGHSGTASRQPRATAGRAYRSIFLSLAMVGERQTQLTHGKSHWRGPGSCIDHGIDSSSHE